ncbi:MAG: AmmeMemoRadiSam system protein B [Nitrospinaceae bacterium]|nr:MAG: AmmeMemoRadiSam system protein B [Nitrospinaceae bacterium]
MIRLAAAAGQFYPETPLALVEEIEKHVDREAVKQPAKAVIAPHAGIRYSGDVAGAVYSRTEIPPTVILLGPNHTGRGDAAALMAGGAWEMPQGPVPIHADLAHAILEIAPLVHIDARAHAGEHSLETQLPFLQYFRPQLSIVPLCFKPLSLAACQEIGLELACTVEQAAGPVLIVASTDMSHYETHVTAQRKDALAIAQILRRDARGLYEIAEAEGISMCGLTPVAVMLAAVNRLGATRAQQVGYMTSGEINGDWDRVVGYLGVTIH